MKQMGRQKKYKKNKHLLLSVHHDLGGCSCFLYNTINHDEYKMSFLEGTVEDIVDNVHTGVSDIGIVYFPRTSINAFTCPAHKDIEFIEIRSMSPAST